MEVNCMKTCINLLIMLVVLISNGSNAYTGYRLFDNLSLNTPCDIVATSIAKPSYYRDVWNYQYTSPYYYYDQIQVSGYMYAPQYHLYKSNANWQPCSPRRIAWTMTRNGGYWTFRQFAQYVKYGTKRGYFSEVSSFSHTKPHYPYHNRGFILKITLLDGTPADFCTLLVTTQYSYVNAYFGAPYISHVMPFKAPEKRLYQHVKTNLDINSNYAYDSYYIHYFISKTDVITNPFAVYYMKLSDNILKKVQLASGIINRWGARVLFAVHSGVWVGGSVGFSASPVGFVPLIAWQNNNGLDQKAWELRHYSGVAPWYAIDAVEMFEGYQKNGQNEMYFHASPRDASFNLMTTQYDFILVKYIDYYQGGQFHANCREKDMNALFIRYAISGTGVPLYQNVLVMWVVDSNLIKITYHAAVDSATFPKLGGGTSPQPLYEYAFPRYFYPYYDTCVLSTFNQEPWYSGSRYGDIPDTCCTPITSRVDSRQGQRRSLGGLLSFPAGVENYGFVADAVPFLLNYGHATYLYNARRVTTYYTDIPSGWHYTGYGRTSTYYEYNNGNLQPFVENPYHSPNNAETNFYVFQNLDGFYIWNWVDGTHTVVSHSSHLANGPQITLPNCGSTSYDTFAQKTPKTTVAGKHFRQMYYPDTKFTDFCEVEFENPWTITCSGTTSICNQCPIYFEFDASIGIDSGEYDMRYIDLNETTSGDKLFFRKQVKNRVNRYAILNPQLLRFNYQLSQIQTYTTDFHIHIIVSLAFNPYDCNSYDGYCWLRDTLNPGVWYTVPGRIYYYSNGYYYPITEKVPQADFMTKSLVSMSNPTTICDPAIHILQLIDNHIEQSYYFDSTQLPTNVDFSSQINKNRNIWMYRVYVKDAAGSYIEPLTQYKELFIGYNTDTLLRFGPPSAPLEFDNMQFYLWKSTLDCILKHTRFDETLHVNQLTNIVQPWLNATIPFKFTLSYCTSQTYTAVDPSTYVIELIKNEGMKTILSFQQILAFFTLADATYCQIRTYNLYRSDQSVYPDGDAMRGRIQTTAAQIGVQTTFTPSALGENQWEHTFQIKVSSVYDTRIAWKTVQVKVGCFRETFLRYTMLLSVPKVDMYSSISAPFLRFVQRKVLPANINLENPSSYIKEFDLNVVLIWESNIPLCGAGSIKLCDDEACNTIISGTEVSVSANPYTKDSNGILPASIVRMDRRTSFTKVIWMKVQNQQATQTVLEKTVWIVCGSETYVKNTSHPVWNTTILRPQEFEKVTNFYFNLSQTFTVNHPYPDACPIQYFEICDHANCSSFFGNQTRMSIDSTFNMTLNIEPQSGLTVYLRARDVNNDVKAIEPVQVFICGFENITTFDNDTVEFQLSTVNFTEPIVLNVSSFFTVSDLRCPFQGWLLNYSLVQGNNSYYNAKPLADKPKKNFKIEGELLTIEMNDLGIMDMFVLASASDVRYGYKHFWFNMTTPPPPYKNKPPDFDNKVNSTIFVDVTINEFGVMEGMDYLEYKTSKVSDLEKDPYIMKHEGFDELPFVSYVLNSDNSTTIRIDKTKIQNSGNHKVKITLADKEGSTKQEIMIKVTFFDARKKFKGVIIDKKEEEQSEKDKLIDEMKKYAAMPEPIMTINRITSEGKILIEFDQDMEFPQGEIKQSYYKQAFVCYITSAIDGSIQYTSFGRSVSAELQQTDENINTRRLQQEDEDEEDDEIKASDKLKFDIIVTNHTAREIVMELKFVDPSFVSSTRDGNDIISFRVVDTSIFKSQLSGKSLNKESIPNNVIRKELPPIIADPLIAGGIKGATKNSKTALNFLSTGNFFVGLILGGSMQQLWGMIRAMQMIILCAVVKVSFPAHTYLFFQGCMLFAKMDVLSGESFFNTYFLLKKTKPLNSNFEGYGYESKSYFLNSGSVFLFECLIIISFLTKFLINKIAVCFAEHTWARKIGMWADKMSFIKQIKTSEMKLFLESYFEQSMCTTLSIIAFTEVIDRDDFLGFINTPGNIFQTIVTFLTSVMVFLFPIYGYIKVKKHFNEGSLDTAEVKSNIGIFYDGIKIKTWSTTVFNFLFMIRRYLTVSVLVWLVDYPFFQIQFLLIFSTINFIYMFTEKPFIVNRANRIEVFNELSILLCIYNTNVLLDESIPTDLKNTIGWILIGVAILNVFVNLALTIFISVVDVFVSCRQKRIQNQVQKAIRDKIKNRKYLKEEWAGAFQAFENEMEAYDAVQFAKEWFPQRQWLVKNGVDGSQLQEEQQFLENLKQFKLYTRAKNVKMFHSIELAANKLTQEEIERKKQQIIQGKLNQTKNLLKKALQRKFTSNRLETIKEETENSQVDLNFEKIDKEEIKQKNVRKILGVIEEKMKNQRFHFDLNALKEDEEALKMKFKAIRHYKDKLQDEVTPELLKVLKDEESGYINSKNKQFKKEITEGINSINDLNFLIESSGDDSDGRELYELVKEDCPYPFEELICNDGLRKMLHPGINNVLQSILQSLIPIRPLAEFFIKKQYELVGQETPLSNLFHYVFVENYKPYLTFLEGKHYQFDLSPFQEFLLKNDIKIKEKYEDAGEVFNELQIILEGEVKSKKQLGFDKEKCIEQFLTCPERDNWYYEQNESKMSELTYHLILSTTVCKAKHIRHEIERQTTLKVKLLNNSSIIDSLESALSWRITRSTCEKCSNAQPEQTIKTFAKLPQLLVIENQLFDKRGKVYPSKLTVPSFLDLKKLVAVQDLVEPTNCLYTLVSFVAFEGENREGGKYVSYSERQVSNEDDVTKEWFIFERKGYKKQKWEKLSTTLHQVQLMFYLHTPEKEDDLILELEDTESSGESIIESSESEY